MANVFESWRKKYSEDDYNNKVSEYKEKLRKKAKENNFGGPVYVKRTCSQCNLIFNGIANQLTCNVCKLDKIEVICKHCNSKFFTQNHKSNCCDLCKTTQPWKRKPCTPEQLEKSSKSMKLWYQSEAGLAHRKKMSEFNSDNMKRFNKTEAGKENIKRKAKFLSNLMKERIANGSFTPKITNTRTHWSAKIILDDGSIRKFRSSWEAAFWASNIYLDYETLRIPWVDKDGKSHTYIPDFYDPKNNIVYEIKPRCQYLISDGKMSQAINYCIDNKIKFIWINETNILNYINQSLPIFTIETNYKQLKKVTDAVKKSTNTID